MEHLTKHQIILVALLVAFVTSITTGIVTVSLTDQSSPSVPQIINHVVERTIEKVVPGEQSAAVVTKETIVVRSEDQVLAAINKNAASIVRLYSIPSDFATTTETFLGLGLVVKPGLIVADRSILGENINYNARTNAGKSYSLELQTIPDANVAFFKAINAPALIPITLGSALPKLGQSVLALGGEINTIVATGIISELDEGTSAINTDLDSKVTVGSPLINLSGEVIGIKTARLNPTLSADSVYLSSAEIAHLLPKGN